ncbi:hypothetical protein ARGLB_032_00680 [Arthrobacter globiformis NBRC 12137]|uniref:Uncharacterized protein n=1 Tax=Arthrobacter globiformis (strain ATCC 8010 / DSM 20124 / JCM 1332 / NBRC 12137 / NCIMB 8907 / NRRL B-2979 / 168) TaxID=1077972 RepID=H0QJM0_ARTG1|nr:hypothetical protein [Arthrobacter globiformis]GAB13021.1 hypothetical protein ARGLB_032_00680 [Arthrobacter globiformis NBRC 12137]
MMPRASFRLFRTGLIGSPVIGFATGGHLAGGGQLPSAAILAALFAVTLVPVAALTRFRLSFPALVALLGAGQFWLHWALDALGGAGAAEPESAALLPGHGGHAGGALDSAFPSPAVAESAHSAASDGVMFVAHAVATLCTAVLLARGERVLATLASWLQPLFRRHEPAVVLPARVPAPFPVPAVLPRTRAGVRLPTRRGPPLPSAA